MGEDTAVLLNCKGFIRLALSCGAHLVPVFGVGMNALCATYPWFKTFRKWIHRKYGLRYPLFHGRWFTPLLSRIYWGTYRYS